MKTTGSWQVYRTRFLVKAKQLTKPMFFVDHLGREHRGEKGDYLVESSDGMFSIAPRSIFKDIYVAMGPADEGWQSPVRSGLSSPVIGGSRGCSRAQHPGSPQALVENRVTIRASDALIA